jgi:hypothetical protein
MGDVTIHVEDFEDDQGGTGFDPLFVHQFTRDDGEPAYRLYDNSTYYPEHGVSLNLEGGTQDAISFNLSPIDKIVYASVDFITQYDPFENDRWAVDFIGTSGMQTIYLYYPGTQYETIGIGSDTVGAITEIRLRLPGEGYFDNITIHVIPEPTILLFALSFLPCWCMRLLWHRFLWQI